MREKLLHQLSRLEERLDQMVELLERLVERETEDPNPWPITLLKEAMTGQDQDGNGAAWGFDFHIDENIENFPPVIQAKAVEFERKGIPDDIVKLSWEDYHDGLPDGKFADTVKEFVDRLGEKSDGS